jgi:hypothetical protein
LLFCKRNESFAALQTQASFAAVVKLMLNLHSLQMVAMFGRFYKKVWPFLTPTKGQFLRKRREITRKFGRNIVTDRKVWP